MPNSFLSKFIILTSQISFKYNYAVFDFETVGKAELIVFINKNRLETVCFIYKRGRFFKPVQNTNGGESVAIGGSIAYYRGAQQIGFCRISGFGIYDMVVGFTVLFKTALVCARCRNAFVFKTYRRKNLCFAKRFFNADLIVPVAENGNVAAEIYNTFFNLFAFEKIKQLI